MFALHRAIRPRGAAKRGRHERGEAADCGGREFSRSGADMGARCRARSIARRETGVLTDALWTAPAGSSTRPYRAAASRSAARQAFFGYYRVKCWSRTDPDHSKGRPLRHGRACPGHPRSAGAVCDTISNYGSLSGTLSRTDGVRVGGRDTPGHDAVSPIRCTHITRYEPIVFSASFARNALISPNSRKFFATFGNGLKFFEAAAERN